MIEPTTMSGRDRDVSAVPPTIRSVADWQMPAGSVAPAPDESVVPATEIVVPTDIDQVAQPRRGETVSPRVASAVQQEQSAAKPVETASGTGEQVLGGLSAERLLHGYYLLTLARALDDRMWAMQRQGKAPFVVACSGHEAAQIGSALALQPRQDWVLPYYRDLGVMLVLGMTPREVMLDFLARAEGPSSGGRQMPNHWSSRELRVVSQSSIVGSQIIHATGVALATQIRREPDVTAVYFGEGATAGGDFHEGLNFAAIRKLPVIFVCENNGYAISVPAEKEMPVQHVAERAAAYAMPGEVVDGMDLLAVYGAMSRAVERARSGGGPTLLEAKVYRFVPHTSDDDDRAYRSREEVERWRQRDPLELFRRRLEESGLLDEALQEETKRRVMREVDDATEYAERAPFASPETVYRHVYAEAA
jgi:2-oxoisovalerate dehydrogenase E1 component alpha subunit